MPSSTARAIHWDLHLGTGVISWTGDLELLLGWPLTELPSRSDGWEDLIRPEDRAQVRAAVREVAAGVRHRADLRYHLRHRTGDYIAVDDRVFAIREDGRAQQLIGAIVPVAAPRAAVAPSLEEQLRESTTRFRTFVESLPLLAWEADGNGWIFYYNQRWYEYTGTTPEQMEGWGWVDVHVPSDLPRMLKVFRHALHTGQPWEDEFRLRRRDGTYRWHLSRAFPLRDASGRIVRWFGTNTDTHDQRMALHEREQLLHAEQQLRREAEAQNRHKDEFLAVVSHELRTPLNAVLGWVQLLQEGGAPDVAAALARIDRNARFLSRLIEDLVDVSRMVTGRLEIEAETVDVLEARDAAVESLRAEAEQHAVTITCGETGGPALVHGSAARLRQVLTNLVGNAIKFSDRGGRVQLNVHSDEREVVITVADQGEGIDPELVEKIFERFTQADSSHRRRHLGLGLGLAIARHLVHLHGGTIKAHSDGIGRGATFTVRLPRAAAGALPSQEPAAPGAVSLAGISVLAVDDDRESRDVLTHMLLNAGATVTVVGSVAAAFEHLRAGVPDVIVTDISMPEIDGHGLADRIRTSPSPEVHRLPLVALTAAASVADRQRAAASGFDAFVAKPVEVATLCRAIIDAIGGRLTQ